MYNLLHVAEDEVKVERLMESLERGGWQGAPLVVDGYNLLTGMHRWTAARRLEWQWQDVPVIEVSDVFAEAGMDWAETLEEAGGDLTTALGELPEVIRVKYGIDAH